MYENKWMARKLADVLLSLAEMSDSIESAATVRSRHVSALAFRQFFHFVRYSIFLFFLSCSWFLIVFLGFLSFSIYFFIFFGAERLEQAMACRAQ